MTQPSTPIEVPLHNETIAGALIDSARISVIASLEMLPEAAPRPLIITADAPEADPLDTVQGCLEQAMQWLDAARIHTVNDGAPVTSLHTIRGRDRSGIGPDDELRG